MLESWNQLNLVYGMYRCKRLFINSREMKDKRTEATRKLNLLNITSYFYSSCPEVQVACRASWFSPPEARRWNRKKVSERAGVGQTGARHAWVATLQVTSCTESDSEPGCGCCRESALQTPRHGIESCAQTEKIFGQMGKIKFACEQNCPLKSPGIAIAIFLPDFALIGLCLFCPRWERMDWS